jgi:hypothetical protein
MLTDFTTHELSEIVIMSSDIRPNKLIKSRRLRPVGHIDHMGHENVHILV